MLLLARPTSRPPTIGHWYPASANLVFRGRGAGRVVKIIKSSNRFKARLTSQFPTTQLATYNVCSLTQRPGAMICYVMDSFYSLSHVVALAPPTCTAPSNTAAVTVTLAFPAARSSSLIPPGAYAGDAAVGRVPSAV